MKVIIAKDSNEMSRRAASIIAEGIRKRPHFVLGLERVLQEHLDLGGLSR